MCSKISCNTFHECLDEEGNLRVYVAHVLEIIENGTPRLEGFHMLQEVRNVLPDEIPVKSDTNFTLEFVLGEASISQTPCRVSIPEMLKLKMQLQELQEK